MTTEAAELYGTKTYKGKTLPLTLLPDESVLVAWETKRGAEELIVTTHRVQVSQRATGWRSKTNIMLESLSACTLEFRSHVVFIILAVLFLVAGLMFISDAPELTVGGVVIGMLFAILYACTRGNELKFITSGAEIRVPSSGRSLNEVRHLIETVEAAKNARYNQLFSRSSS